VNKFNLVWGILQYPVVGGWIDTYVFSEEEEEVKE